MKKRLLWNLAPALFPLIHYFCWLVGRSHLIHMDCHQWVSHHTLSEESAVFWITLYLYVCESFRLQWKMWSGFLMSVLRCCHSWAAVTSLLKQNWASFGLTPLSSSAECLCYHGWQALPWPLHLEATQWISTPAASRQYSLVMPSLTPDKTSMQDAQTSNH